MTSRQPSRHALAVLLCAGAALWVSAGAVAITSAQPGTLRVAVLPSLKWLAVLLAAAAMAALIWRPPLGRAGILVCSLVILLPWIPLPIPDAFLTWAGPLRLWVWVGLAVALAVPSIRSGALAAAVRARDPRRAPQLAALIAGAVYLFAAWQLSPRV